ncbi:aldehyde dehydrogenase family protein [Niveispirillum sp.]|jgi:acyl-CoA reductase-like NAD-dependent aldehyde dehydrogenase|uniref:aldehyde dehydrogenase family protein n=1 Tax=Niveispirillum sp. TaxID=1917217 RepID=UPI001B3D4702|nr:aldehyde dehydrogenase family protein [Niveispirillum sp.]MBP6636100.1 aldehyde dehydrogenase family protein [Sulfuritalea sp.]MBP7339170.1 aldehyde dehydrogenase family protein [Niveispirillum sp.]MBP8897182.1 aldehyde dehydrogenase family protein [Sulfuritalea sp.]MCC6518676.1 aldehyde dehydrogenase family protein [Tabrizicola sp.]
MKITCVSPVDGKIYAERAAISLAEARAIFARAKGARGAWAATPLAERRALLEKAVDHLVAAKSQIATEIAWQMGRPVSQCGGEVRGLEERARHMLAIAPQALEEDILPQNGLFLRTIRKEPLGTVFVIAPWNYPYLTATNAIFPALVAGNVVVLKHSAQTLVCGERFAEAFAAAGLPDGVFQLCMTTNDDTTALIGEGLHDHIVFTGSVSVGRHLQTINAAHFTGIDLELGGKDPAYVRADANVDWAAENLVDGAFFNSGQSCCGIERIYVHKDIYPQFVEKFVTLTEAYVLGNPTAADVTLGPVASTRAAEFVRAQIAEACEQGARALIDPGLFPADRAGTPYLAPQVLVDVTHDMRVMTEESFGPVVGIMAVDGDDEAIAMMNDSDYGLTASIWTADLPAAEAIALRLETGTCFANRCDYLDPGLAWTGVKDTGRGCSLSAHAFDHLTRLKSYHFRAQPA